MSNWTTEIIPLSPFFPQSHCFSVPESNLESHIAHVIFISSDLWWQFLGLSLMLMTLILSKSTGCLFWECPSICLSDVFSWLGWGHAILVRISKKWYCTLLSVFYHRGQGANVITGDINLDHLVKVSAGFLHCKVMTFPLIINKDLGEEPLDYRNNLFLHKILPISFNIH